MITTEQGTEILTKLQTFWSIEWSQRMGKRHTDSTVEEIRRAFKDFDAETALEAVRTWADTNDRPPTFRQLVELCRSLKGEPEAVAWRWDQYIASIKTVVIDGYPYEFADTFPVKVYTDGRVIAPSGRKVDTNEAARQGLIPAAARGARRPKTAPQTRENAADDKRPIWDFYERITDDILF